MSMNCRETGVGSRESGVLESWSLGVSKSLSLGVWESRRWIRTPRFLDSGLQDFLNSGLPDSRLRTPRLPDFVFTLISRYHSEFASAAGFASVQPGAVSICLKTP